MDVITIESRAFKEIQENLKEIREELNKAKQQNIEDTWLSSKQVQKILGVSQKTWQTYRDKKLIDLPGFIICQIDFPVAVKFQDKVIQVKFICYFIKICFVKKFSPPGVAKFIKQVNKQAGEVLVANPCR